MQSSTGKYFLGLDHVRALAAFQVFTWHFIHANDNRLATASFIPLSLFTEGHTGVALFMTLSGYLFAKLLDGKDIDFASFLWNRALRLLPLLLLVILIVGFRDYFLDGKATEYIRRIAIGLLRPSLPNGGWSITVEFHFYLLLPVLLLSFRRFRWSLLVFVVAAVALRLMSYLEHGEVQSLAYWTIVGRADQFILGIAAYQYRHLFLGRHVLAALVFFSFCYFYWSFEVAGGFYENSTSWIWVVMTTIEGLAYGSLIAWYDSSFSHSSGRISTFVAKIGAYSYSIYLLHFFFYARIAAFISQNVVPLSDPYLAVAFSPFAFLMMVPFGYLSFRFVEAPFLRFRTRYVR